ncbi:MAG: hypothetical protein IH948_03590 [Bacteroidetes bacterium]|nr:hypothetical protein [Bacteroidota bacterium]
MTLDGNKIEHIHTNKRGRIISEYYFSYYNNGYLKKSIIIKDKDTAITQYDYSPNGGSMLGIPSYYPNVTYFDNGLLKSKSGMREAMGHMVGDIPDKYESFISYSYTYK